MVLGFLAAPLSHARYTHLQMYSKWYTKGALDYRQFAKRLWGDFYFDEATRKFSRRAVRWAQRQGPCCVIYCHLTLNLAPATASPETLGLSAGLCSLCAGAGVQGVFTSHGRGARDVGPHAQDAWH